MEKFCEFLVHEYMDMHPRTHVRTFVADTIDGIREKAIKYAQYMNKNYSGGTTTFKKVMNAKEAKAHVDSVISYEKANWQDGSQEFIDNINNLYKKCYEEE